ncbi:MAG: hypothetical protein JRD04_12835, partial [Deltaproteobacteria bacterium]|nr:hypothetical protein [Deltaproteobacteria bacterium]
MKLFFKLFLAIFLVVFIVLAILSYNQFSLPTSTEMDNYFLEHQEAFKQKNDSILAALQLQKPITLLADSEIGYKWVEIEPKPNVYQAGKPLIVRYYTHLRGIGVGAFGTGIAYIDPRIEEKEYPDLEAMIDDTKKVEGFIGYSKISDNWYYFFWEA